MKTAEEIIKNANIETKPLLSMVVLYTEDEEGHVAECIKDNPPWIETVVVKTQAVDEGEARLHEDRTERNGLKVAGLYTHPKDLKVNGKVLKGVYVMDFADARNKAKSLATGKWILSIDADERFASFQWPSLKHHLEELEKKNPKAGALLCTNTSWYMDVFDANGDCMRTVQKQHKIFRADIDWGTAIHEQIIESITKKGYVAVESGFQIIHLGYACDYKEMLKKLYRNLYALWQHPELMNIPYYRDKMTNTTNMIKNLELRNGSNLHE